MNRRSLSANSPFSSSQVTRSRPILPVIPQVAFSPTSGDSTQGSFSLSSITFSVDYTSGLINSTISTASRIATQGFNNIVGLVSISLSSSILNTSTDAVMGLIVGKDNGVSVSCLSSSDVFVAHWCQAGAIHSMRSGVTFADETAPKYDANESIAIYLVSSGSGVLNNRATATVTLRYFTF